MRWDSKCKLQMVRGCCYTPPKIAPVVTEDDFIATQRKKKSLQFDMDTLIERMMWNLNWKMNYYLPGYRTAETARDKPSIENLQPERTIFKRICPVLYQMPHAPRRNVLSGDVFERLSTPRTRFPSPCHAATCDAFMTGIATRGGKDGVFKVKADQLGETKARRKPGDKKLQVQQK